MYSILDQVAMRIDIVNILIYSTQTFAGLVSISLSLAYCLPHSATHIRRAAAASAACRAKQTSSYVLCVCCDICVFCVLAHARRLKMHE